MIIRIHLIFVYDVFKKNSAQQINRFLHCTFHTTWKHEATINDDQLVELHNSILALARRTPQPPLTSPLSLQIISHHHRSISDDSPINFWCHTRPRESPPQKTHHWYYIAARGKGMENISPKYIIISIGARIRGNMARCEMYLL